MERLRNRPEPHDTLGWVYLKNNQPVDAIAEFTKALDLAPQSKTYREHLEMAKARLATPR